ncbi:hypothetical protein CJU90_5714 [Yarrowia sp. C11]|nr:hypothetical protein CJU90_5714 [Yarrowia sp. C11]KAG5364296.1 hypothetical protein CKK34_3092 [Yarrowia sp. E02]
MIQLVQLGLFSMIEKMSSAVQTSPLPCSAPGLARDIDKLRKTEFTVYINLRPGLMVFIEFFRASITVHVVDEMEGILYRHKVMFMDVGIDTKVENGKSTREWTGYDAKALNENTIAVFVYHDVFNVTIEGRGELRPLAARVGESSDWMGNFMSLFSKILDISDKMEKTRPKSTPSKGFKLLHRVPDSTNYMIVCSDGVTIAVHSIVLKSVWPYFAKLTSSEPAKIKEGAWAVPYGSTWVFPLIKYCYGELETMTFEEASGALVLAQRYDLPELSQILQRHLLGSPLNIETCLLGWKRAFEAKNTVVRHYCARHYYQHMNELAISKTYTELTREELVQLGIDAGDSLRQVGK